MPMFRKPHIDALFGEIEDNWKETPDREQLHRDAHLAIALHDAGRPIPAEIVARVLALLEKHKPG